MMNVILITCDCLRPDFIDAYNLSRLPEELSGSIIENRTPNIDSLAKMGIMCLNTFSQGINTEHSVPSMLSSSYPLDLGGIGSLSDRVVLAEILEANGYHCYGFNSNPWLSRHYNYQRGFEYYYDGLRYSRLRYLANPFVIGERLTDYALSRISDKNSSPFFVWIHYMDTHLPYRTDSIYKRLCLGLAIRQAKKHPERVSNSGKGAILGAYQRGVKIVDLCISQILENLSREGIMDETMIILTADHGEEFWEHGEYGHYPRLYNDVLHVPMIVVDPNSSPQVYSGMTCLLDIVPTVLGALGIHWEGRIEGRNILELIKGSCECEDRLVISEEHVNSHDSMFLAGQDRNWKCIINYDGTAELYKLVEDPLEQNECSKKYPEVTRDYRKRLMQHVERYLDNGGLRETKDRTVPNDISKRLRALGYLE